MLPSKSLLSLILVGLTAVDASTLGRGTSNVTLTSAMRINNRNLLNLSERDRARATFFQSGSRQVKSNTFFSDANVAVAITTQVGIGSPPSNYTLIIDTGSSNTWVGASKSYVPTNTSNNTGYAVSQSYGAGDFTGIEWTDTVTLAPDLVIENQSIGVASLSEGISSFDGILGLGPVDLTENSVTNSNTVPTVSDNLKSQGKIPKEVVGIYCVPASELISNGTVTFGGYDSSLITHSVKYVSLTTTLPASKNWGIDQSIHYGDTVILSKTAGIVDTGTTLILIASDAFQRYQSATGATVDRDNTGLLTIAPSQYSALKALSFHIGGNSFDLSPNGQIWPRSLNTVLGGNSTSIYLIVSDLGSQSGSGFDFVNGLSFLERFYSVFDTTNRRVGFAPTAYTNAITN